MTIIVIILLSIVVEAVTEILTSSEITDPIRLKWKLWAYPDDKPPPDTTFQAFKIWVDKLISCGYCTSVWVAGFFAVFIPQLYEFQYYSGLLNWIGLTFLSHRISNWIHVVYELIRKGRVKTVDLVVKMEDSDGSIGESTGESQAEIEPSDTSASYSE